MQLKTIFNRVTEYKPFVVEHVELVEYGSQPTIEVFMRARGNGLPACSVCGERCSTRPFYNVGRQDAFCDSSDLMGTAFQETGGPVG